MNVSLPVYVEQRKGDAPGQRLYSVRPLFAPEHEVRAGQLNRAIMRLNSRLVEIIHGMASLRSHRALAEFIYAPMMRERVLDIGLEIGKKTVRARCLFIEIDALGRTVAFTPLLPDLWFCVERGQTLKDRSREYFESIARHPDYRNHCIAESLENAPDKSWLTSLEFTIPLKQSTRQKKKHLFAELSGSSKADGLSELHRTGRCLNNLFPDELDRVLFREEEVADLTRILDDKEARPVLLVGPPGVGKTALLHEYVHRAVSSEKAMLGKAKKVWLLSPQRLISGMSYVGQWEDRIYSILELAKGKEHVLYFDDLVGLFLAGQSSQSQLSIADLLKRCMELREIRVIGEITPSALRVLQETDRNFADQFDILPVREPSSDRTLRILIRVIQQLELQHNATFAPDVLPAVIDLQRRYTPEVVFPGKGAAFLRQLAIKHKKEKITRATALQEFKLKSGMSLAFLDDRQKLARRDVLDALKQKIIGQEAALEAFADAVCLAKARINDPHRPLASFLFLGPTGVGKTQCAKALAEHLFGSADKLLRFDLNEYVDPGAAAKLTGTASEPEGLLTSAVRRQPFSVVLLDEVEKCDPSIHDLLLQVLGEGRLTDARGRTTDFTNCIVILTSNLGVRESSATMGLKQGATTSDPSIFVRAAEKFFRPEFFNRLDRVIPFGRLQRDEIGRIAKLLIQDVFRRDGLVRRRCILQIHPAAMNRVIDAGYDPILGARALKRSIEQQLTRPAAAYLAGCSPELPAIISLYPAGEGISVDVQMLNHAEPAPGLEQLMEKHGAAKLLEASRAALKRIGAELERRRPRGDISSSTIRPEHHAYFSARENLVRVAQWVERTTEHLQPKKPVRGLKRRAVVGVPSKTSTLRISDLRANWAALFSTTDLPGLIKDAATDSGDDETQTPYVMNIIRQISLLESMLGEYARVVLFLRAIDENMQSDCDALAKIYQPLLAAFPGLDVISAAISGSGQAALVLEGPQARALASAEEGTHLFIHDHKQISAIQAVALPVNAGQTPESVIDAKMRECETWLKNVAAGKTAPAEHPLGIKPVIRVYYIKSMLDVHSGVFMPEAASHRNVSDFVLGRLPLAPEFQELL